MSHLDPRDIAAQALCLLAQAEDRPELNTAGRTDDDDDDDCFITHVRPAPHRHHPYRRPGEQFDAATVTRARRDAEARLARQLGGRDQWNVFPLEEHEAQPESEVPSVRRVGGGDGEAVTEKVPLPLPVPRPSSGPAPGPVRRTDVFFLPQGPLPSPQPAEASRKPLPDKKPAARKPLPAQQQPAVQKPLPAKQPAVAPPRTPGQRWADESRAFAALQIAFPLDTYTYRSLVLQALLAAPESEWLHSSEITEYLTDKYPTLRAGNYYLTTLVCATLRDFFSVKAKLVEKTSLRGLKRNNLWRVLPEARDEASTIASRKKPVMEGTRRAGAGIDVPCF